MACFLNNPAVSWVGGRYPWRLEQPLVYKSDILGHIVVPEGYCTDFASVPRIPGVFALTGDRATLASIVHDYLYDARPDNVTRRQADRVFREAMRVARDPKTRTVRAIMYAGVRAGGWAAWRRDSRHKLDGLSGGQPPVGGRAI